MVARICPKFSTFFAVTRQVLINLCCAIGILGTFMYLSLNIHVQSSSVTFTPKTGWLDIAKIQTNTNTSAANDTMPDKPPFVSVEDYMRYLELRTNYNRRMSNVSRYKFRPVTDFIDYGESVAKFMPPNSPRVKKILKWTTFYGNNSYIPSILRCPDNYTCETTSDRKQLLNSDAVVFHFRDFDGPDDLPKQRLPHQRWVHFLLESPYNAFKDFRQYNGVFNYTAVYRSDSDIQTPYFTIGKREKPLTEVKYQALYTNITQSQTKLLAARISKCESQTTRRLSYVRELSKHIALDVLDHCFTMKCQSAVCEKKRKVYKFYMAIENANCRDYITEKVKVPLFELGSVPVIMGGADPSDYERALPIGSYIHTAGFSSPIELAEYLQLLGKNPALYKRYHVWRMHWEMTDDLASRFCPLCSKLYNQALPVQTYRDFAGWYAQDTCTI